MSDQSVHKMSPKSFLLIGVHSKVYCLMVDADTKQVLAVAVTDEAVRDSTELPALLEEAVRNVKEEEQ